ncbi:MAG: SynChlorMet cassette radical SAM/SPASM protein ScmF [Victivallales bacterium]|nr:SynChlorMet cassette radical SAM/SPASM protein ScmF [Victivallales bacterium]
MTKKQKTEINTSDLEKDIPSLNSIYFYLTEGCNCKCRHCWITPKYEAGGKGKWPYIALPEFKKVIEQGLKLGLTSVKLTGGEPLIHPDIIEILAYIEKTDLRLIIETNGLACSPEIATAIKRCSNSFVSISLDGAKAETHNWVRGVDDAYDRALEGIRNLVEVGIHPQLIMSLVKRNRDQIEELVELAEKLGAESVKFNLVSPLMDRGEQMSEQNEVLNVKDFIEIGRKITEELQPKSKIRLHYSHPFAFKSLSAIFDKNDTGCCGIFGIIGVLGSGKYALCGIGENVPEMIFGDVKKDKLADIWNNNNLLDEIRNGLPEKLEGVCGDCVMKTMCLGECIANNYFVHHNLFGSYWFCEAALKMKIFPISRLTPGSKSAKKMLS